MKYDKAIREFSKLPNIGIDDIIKTYQYVLDPSSYGETSKSTILKVLIHQYEGIRTKPKFFPGLVLVIGHGEKGSDLTFFRIHDEDRNPVKKLLKENNIEFCEDKCSLGIFPYHLKDKNFKDVITILVENSYLDSTMKDEMLSDIKSCYIEPSKAPQLK